jgi:hypothetical protein
MSYKTWQRLMLGGMLVLTTAPTVLAQAVPVLPDRPVLEEPIVAPELPDLPEEADTDENAINPELPLLKTPILEQIDPILILPALPKFSCGPHLATYVVRPLDNRPGRGIRCVKFSNGSPSKPRTPRIAWYGEGNWYGKTYRHVGHAFYKPVLVPHQPLPLPSSLKGYASDMNGNGEDIHNNFPGNLQVQIVNPSRIRVTGAWNEEWIRVNEATYKPLARPKVCGSYFDQYKVADLVPLSQGGRQGDGMRCVLRVGPAGTAAPKRYFTTWFGNGQWTGSKYSHLGTRSTAGVGASDICGSTFGPICNNFPYGSLKVKPVPGGYDVTGAWREMWR